MMRSCNRAAADVASHRPALKSSPTPITIPCRLASEDARADPVHEPRCTMTGASIHRRCVLTRRVLAQRLHRSGERRSANIKFSAGSRTRAGEAAPRTGRKYPSGRSDVHHDRSESAHGAVLRGMAAGGGGSRAMVEPCSITIETHRIGDSRTQEHDER